VTSTQTLRLPSGGRIDRSRPIGFKFNGRALHGYAGDTLASALLANGVQTVARSFKFHRPRGVLSAGCEEPNALLRVSHGGTVLPITRATLQPLLPGLEASSENCYPGVDFDLGRVLDLTHPLWPAGFYHKTFKWPRWEVYERFVRRAAGLGTVPEGRDPARYFEHNLHCDVLVVGGGAAGIAAALEAGRAGTRVVVLEQEPEFGAALEPDTTVAGAPAETWLAAALDELARLPAVRLMPRTLAAGYYDHNVLTALDHSSAEHEGGRVERYWKIRAREVVLATGAIEQPLVFGYNDRPGMLLASAVRRYLQRHAVAAGRRVLVATNNDDAWRTAFVLHDAGVAVAGIVDCRERPAERLQAAAAARGLPVHTASLVVESRGRPAVHCVAIARLTSDGRALQGRRRWIDCDAVAMSGGWNPTVHLYSQAGGEVAYDEQLACIVPVRCRQRVRIVGAANGEFGVDAAIESARVAGREAAQDACGPAGAGYAAGRLSDSPREARREHRGETNGIRAVRRAPGVRSNRQWVDFQHDVTVADIELAVRENYVSVEHLKRYTTTGMAVDQGKTSNLNALALLAELTRRPVGSVGTTTFRPQYLPVTMGAIRGGASGALYAPVRELPLRERHLELRAQLDDYGGWRRPACYPRNRETREQAIEREMLAVRRRLALFDGSPLGKIEVRGPGAATFIDRVYVNNMRSLPVGRVRYGLMINENGIVIDDGVCARLGEEHYLLSTTSGGADRISQWLEEWHQGEWPELELVMLPVTTQWAVLNLVGRRARTVLETLPGDIDFSAGALPHMHVRSGTLDGLPARVQRVSFTGELSYEIAVPAASAAALWTRLMQAGVPHGIEPVGVEAWVRLRIEKGYLHVGADTDGTTNPLDLGFAQVVRQKRGDFVGRRSLERVHDRRSDRRQLVGIEPVEPSHVFVAGAHIVTGDGRARRSEGFVTSACHSPVLGRTIGLALLERGAARLGERVTVFESGRTAVARVVSPVFYDAEGIRLDG
jgi:sarcosine oxidase subunit alpha